MRAGLVVFALKMAYSRGYVAKGAIFHSDRGSQYTSSEFAAWAAAHDVRLSVGRTGSCHDNAVAESFFGTLKNEWYYLERLSDASTTKHKAHEFNRVVLQPLPPARVHRRSRTRRGDAGVL
ncbi:MAG: transposase [Coriobacteriaceae bacterium]|nr:MAG: transposase [Coriobacteriaceae bacterium]